MVLLAASLSVAAAGVDDVVRYDIQVQLDPETHRLHGVEQVRWSNNTSAATSELWLHLYLNAFASPRTTFMRELGSGTLRRLSSVEMDWGWIRLTRLETVDGVDLLGGLEFIRPDDGNPDDFTVARIQLPREVPPGSSVDLEVSFESQLPTIIARTGFAGDFHFAGQWFPKLGVFEDAGVRGRPEAEWNCHQYHANSDYYADFGTFRVELRVPEGWVVGATGVEVERAVVHEGSTSRLRVTFRADRVHDFAWCAAPGGLLEVVEDQFDPLRHVPSPWLDRASTLLEVSPAELELPPVHLRLLVPRTQLALAPRMIRAARLAMAWYGLHYGPYPYPQLTIVSPPPTADEAGGMEYPTLVTTGAHHALSIPPTSWSSRIETVTVHEIGHQYFYGLLASNEFEQAWLDEGLNSYAEIECMEAIAADGLAPEMKRADFWSGERAWLAVHSVPMRVDRAAWEFRRRWDYYTASYTKAAVVLRTLEGLVGQGAFARAMRAYAERFRFRHPTGEELQAVFEEVSGQELGWYFDQTIRSDAMPDWAVLRVQRHEPDSEHGLAWRDGAWSALEPDDLEAPRGSTTVELARLGDLVGPVEVELAFADGSSERRTWEGVERWVRWTLGPEPRLTQVVVDPDGVWALETSRHDNYWRDEANRELTHRATSWLQRTLLLIDLIRPPWS
jgi:hypothetical protein